MTKSPEMGCFAAQNRLSCNTARDHELGAFGKKPAKVPPSERAGTDDRPSEAVVIEEESLLRTAIVELLRVQLGYQNITSIESIDKLALLEELRFANLIICSSSVLEKADHSLPALFKRSLRAPAAFVVFANRSPSVVAKFWFAHAVDAVLDRRLDERSVISALRNIANGARAIERWAPLHSEIAELETVALHVQGLTPRMKDVLGLLCAGASTREIAKTLSVTLATAKAHVTTIIQRLNLGNRSKVVSAMYQLQRRGMIEISSLQPVGILSDPSSVGDGASDKQALKK